MMQGNGYRYGYVAVVVATSKTVWLDILQMLQLGRPVIPAAAAEKESTGASMGLLLYAT
jgi:hypothetical protein